MCAVWYQASQICAVLSVILVMPALVAGTLYSYVVSLSGRSRASWVLIAFLAAVGQCARRQETGSGIRGWGGTEREERQREGEGK